MLKLKKLLPKMLSLALILTMAVAIFSEVPEKKANAEYLPQQEITKLDLAIDTGVESFFDDSVVYKLPSQVKDNDDISVIVEMNVDGMLDSYNKNATSGSVYDYFNQKEGRQTANAIQRERNKLLRMLKNSGIPYVLGETYETLFGGFEVTVKAKDFERLNNLLDSHATLMVGEVYNPCESVVVKNLVDVYETGIFDSSSCEYQGDGVVVAVLDTGLDYTHTAFESSEDHFITETEKFTLDTVSQVIDDTVASTLTRGLAAEDVYLNRKVPFAYDYGDKDPDVLPINSEHGTHVAGIIAGKDDTITGVAPNAQLAIMKVFSDTQTGAKTSWILAALEDCVTLGVDVINMSLGTSCGFTREVDKENVNKIYDKIHEQGISLIAAASNDYNATFGSDKNGSNGLTSNPDSGTVGSPSTYDGPLSVASVDGVETPYLLHDGDIIYFTEASTSDAEQKKSFVNDILKEVGNVESYDFPYVTIPGIGKSSDYSEDNYAGKIVLVKRGVSTFEDKVRIALKEKGAAGIIIYNNVSGTISMSVGADIGAVCSISQDEGEKLAKASTGTITVSKKNTAGPFMSDFSSWGPTSDLRIKPEITSHGGEILSAVPGQGYERLSGTSMAAPNQAGAAALIRQYVIYSGTFGENLAGKTVNSLVNKLMMSTADIVMNKNGLPYAVRKQGAGLININKATTTASYVTTYDKEGNAMDKTKLELGDDKARKGVYEMTFDITNISGSEVSYALDTVMMTEGVSPTYTGHDDTTVTMDGYLLEGTTLSVTSVEGGSKDGNNVKVSAGQTAKVTVKVTLSEEDKQYIADSFEYGMYVEGFITMEALSGTEVSMNVPVLAFFGDWTEAPIFDEEYYDTHKDELNDGLDDNDKLMADAYATRVIGGLYSDYISTLGTYYFVQDPKAVKIPASKEHISLSNQTGDSNWTVNTIRSINAGLLRNAKQVDITITEDATGRVIFKRTEYNQMKSFSQGSNIYASSIDTEFSVLEHNLKNNTKYTVKVEAYIDYGTHEDQKNVRNTFEFPVYIDFEAPVITDVNYRTEYDRSTKKTKLYADIYVYDNHYAMGMQIGQITRAEDPKYLFSISSFGKYVTPVYSTFNSTSLVTVELTDYVSQIKNSVGARYLTDGTVDVVENTNTYTVTCYDYAMNSATYELQLPDEVKAMYFSEDTIKLSPNETKTISSLLNVYPSSSWIETLSFTTSDDNVCDVVNQTIIAKTSGAATVTATGKDKDGNSVSASMDVVVLSEGDEGYVGGYTVPSVNKFTLTGYKTNKAYYGLSSDEREIGFTDGEYSFGGDYTLSMYPSESVTLKYLLDSYFPEKTEVRFSVGNEKIATIDENGTIVAKAKGNTNVMVNIYFDGKSTLFSQRVAITVKDPFKITAIYLNSYKGLGGEVIIPDDRGITTIYEYAFSNYEYVDKDPEVDIINEEDPLLIKPQFIGENTITKVVIPEGVTDINSYAFANLTALEEVVLPSTLTRIGVGAFYNCTKLKKINLENAKFINEKAFYNCPLEEINLSSVVSIGNYTFENCKLNYVSLPTTSQSLGIGAFYNNDALVDVQFAADKIKVGSNAFANCDNLESININAAVVSSYAFANCGRLSDVTLGKDVAVIGEYAFAGTKVAKFKLNSLNPTLTLGNNGAIIYEETAGGKELVLVAPQYGGSFIGGKANVIETDATSIAVGAFAGNVKVFKIVANNVKTIANYAFAQCSNLGEVSLNNATTIGDYAFFGDVNLKVSPNLSNLAKVGKYAFYATFIKELTLPDNCTVDNYAFAFMPELKTVTVGNNVTIGEGAFYCPLDDNTYESTGSFDYYRQYDYVVKDDQGNVLETYAYYRYVAEASSISKLETLTIGDNVTIGLAAFANNINLKNLTFGQDVVIGERAFFNDTALETVDFTTVKSIGDYAFSGLRMNDFWLSKSVWRPAYEMQYIDGEIRITGYMYASYAPRIKSLNLENVEYIGKNAFAYNDALTEVTFNQAITSISEAAFAYCIGLKEINLPETVTSIGDYAFVKTSLTEANLANVTEIGEGAFARTLLKSATLPQAPTTIGDSAFAFAYGLENVENLNFATTIGADAFNSTKLTSANLENAETIGDFAFENSALTSVTLGEKLTSVGENPFTGCEIESFGKKVDVEFGGKVIGQEFLEDYNISETVMVSDGVIYQKLPSGKLELVSFPMASKLGTYTVKEDTARISANAFAGSKLSSVVLPTTLKSIGHKAFYGMENISVVTFLGLTAPILEEEYDESVLTYSNLPITGNMGAHEGIGITDYYMWNVTSRFNNFYFGANFSDYVGHVTKNITMVAPSNGQYYDTFIFNKYFSSFAKGSPARTEQTNEVIKLIDAIPESVSLAAEEVVQKARAAYDALPSTEQKSLVTNYNKLSQAESVLTYLKGQNEPTPPPEQPVETKKPFTETPYFVAIMTVAGIILGLGVAILVYVIWQKKKSSKK